MCVGEENTENSLLAGAEGAVAKVRTQKGQGGGHPRFGIGVQAAVIAAGAAVAAIGWGKGVNRRVGCGVGCGRRGRTARHEARQTRPVRDASR